MTAFLKWLQSNFCCKNLILKVLDQSCSPKSIQPIHYLMFASLLICLRIGGLDHWSQPEKIRLLGHITALFRTINKNKISLSRDFALSPFLFWPVGFKISQRVYSNLWFVQYSTTLTRSFLTAMQIILSAQLAKIDKWLHAFWTFVWVWIF